MASKWNVSCTNEDTDFFAQIKEIITDLVQVEPNKRMKLEVVKEKLELLKNDYSTKFNFILLDNFLNEKTHDKDDIFQTNTEENSQTSHRLMDDIRKTRLFTIPTTGNEMKLTQRLTNLCVSVAAMRLLSFALIEFLKQQPNNCEAKIAELEKLILRYPIHIKSPKKSKPDQTDDKRDEEDHENYLNAQGPTGSQPAKDDDTYFIVQLITICCGVISPRSLNGLNHCNIDDEYQVAGQEQKIGKSILFSIIPNIILIK